MSGLLTIEGLQIPTDISDLAAFRRWVGTLGEDGPRVHFSNGRVWIQMSPQNYHSHLWVVTAINTALGSLATEQGRGRYCHDGGWVTNEGAGLSTEPDGFLVLWDTFRSGAAKLLPRPERQGSVELVGRGDMVVEVVSDRSERKDTVELVRDYAAAGFPEYWIVDARVEPLSLRILALDADTGRYEDVPADREGWKRSQVWGRRFKLTKTSDPVGLPVYELLIAP